jgi:hypothetical protein
MAFASCFGEDSRLIRPLQRPFKVRFHESMPVQSLVDRASRILSSLEAAGQIPRSLEAQSPLRPLAANIPSHVDEDALLLILA